MKLHDVFRIGELFATKGWSTDGDAYDQFPLLFENFCRMSARLNEAERHLVIQLSHDYVWIRPPSNTNELCASWGKFLQSLPPEIKTIGIAPLLAPNSKRPKSSDALFYLARGIEARLRHGVEAELVFRASADEFFDIQLTPNANALVLLDDYVGSGGTAIEALSHLKQKALENNTRIFVLALVAQREAVARLQANDAHLVSGRLVDKSISGNSKFTSPDIALTTMRGIGKYLGVKNDIALGYVNTEAVVTMTRTPNNTFPVFWTNKKVKGVVWNSPFTRFTDRCVLSSK